MKPKVGIIGKGKVGSAVKQGLERAAYDVRMVGKDPKGVPETTKWADIVILAIPFHAVDETISEMGQGVEGKVVIDVTNVYTPEDLAAMGTKSGAEELQRKVPKARVVKALNMHFAKNMGTGHIGDEQLTYLVAGDDKDARSTALQLGRDLGFDAVDAGPLANAKLLESLGLLNIQLGFALGLGRDIGFKLIRGSAPGPAPEHSHPGKTA